MKQKIKKHVILEKVNELNFVFMPLLYYQLQLPFCYISRSM